MSGISIDPDDPRLRFRVWVAGILKHEVWINVDDADAEQQMEAGKAAHVAIVKAAEEAGNPWLVEVYDPALPVERAHSRWGTDPDGMVDPRSWADVEHLRTADGRCVISLGGQGHLPCAEHSVQP